MIKVFKIDLNLYLKTHERDLNLLKLPSIKLFQQLKEESSWEVPMEASMRSSSIDLYSSIKRRAESSRKTIV